MIKTKKKFKLLILNSIAFSLVFGISLTSAANYPYTLNSAFSNVGFEGSDFSEFTPSSGAYFTQSIASHALKESHAGFLYKPVEDGAIYITKSLNVNTYKSRSVVFAGWVDPYEWSKVRFSIYYSIEDCEYLLDPITRLPIEVCTQTSVPKHSAWLTSPSHLSQFHHMAVTQYIPSSAISITIQVTVDDTSLYDTPRAYLDELYIGMGDTESGYQSGSYDHDLAVSLYAVHTDGVAVSDRRSVLSFAAKAKSLENGKWIQKIEIVVSKSHRSSGYVTIKDVVQANDQNEILPGSSGSVDTTWIDVGSIAFGALGLVTATIPWVSIPAGIVSIALGGTSLFKSQTAQGSNDFADKSEVSANYIIDTGSTESIEEMVINGMLNFDFTPSDIYSDQITVTAKFQYGEVKCFTNHLGQTSCSDYFSHYSEAIVLNFPS